MRLHHYLLLLLIFCLAVVPAQAEVKYTFKNKCADIDPVAPKWDCLNRTQAAQSREAVAQLLLAVKNTGFKKDIPFVLRDPKILRSEEYGRYWQFGAWYVNGKIEFAAMPSCVGARRQLERLLRRLK